MRKPIELSVDEAIRIPEFGIGKIKKTCNTNELGNMGFRINIKKNR